MNLVNASPQALRDIVLKDTAQYIDPLKEQALDELLRRAASDTLEVGDLVAPKLGHVLRSGGNAYLMAIVVNVEPFVLVSCDGDMLWRNVRPEHVASLGTAMPHEEIRALRRWKEEQLKTNESTR